MRYKRALPLAALLLTQCSLRSSHPLVLLQPPDVTLSIAIPDFRQFSPTDHLHIIIQNTSGKPQAHYQEWNSWGHDALTLHWSDTHGHSGTIERVPTGFTVNFPATTTLQPNESMVRDVSFDPKLWTGLPTTHGDTLLTLTATYHPLQRAKDAPAFTDPTTSPPLTLTVNLP